MASKAEISAAILRGNRDVQQVFGSLTATQLDTPAQQDGGTWTVGDVLGHLAGREQVYAMMYQAARGDNPFAAISDFSVWNEARVAERRGDARDDLLAEFRNEFDLVLAGLPSAEMIEPWGGGSAFAWTYGHVANSIDSWINVRFQRRAPHPIIGDHNLRFGGDGRATDWSVIQQGVTEVRESARDYLYQLTDSDLDLVIPYDGSLVALHSQGLSLRHAVTVNLVHHHYHVGEIATKRAQLGHIVPHLSGLKQRLGK